MNPFTDKFVINSYDVTPDGYASPGAILRIMQECACRHAELLGRGHGELLTRNQMWVLSRLRMRINAFPKWGDEITIKTWPSSAERIFFYREFIITGQSGETLIKADSAWSVVDFKKGRVCRVNVFPELDFANPEQVFPDRPDKLIVSDNLSTKHELLTRYMDLDMNNHVNNVRCVEYMLEFFTDDFLSENRLTGLEANFLGQIDYMEKVCVQGKEVKQNGFDLALQTNNNKRPATIARAEFTGGKSS